MRCGEGPKHWLLFGWFVVLCVAGISAQAEEIAVNIESDIWLVNLSTGEQTEIVGHRADDWGAAWDRAGQRIAFVTGRNRNNDIFMLGIDDDAAAVALTTDPADDRDPCWLPDGGGLVFSSDRDGEAELYLLTLQEEGGSYTIQQLTENHHEDTQPDVSPDGRYIVFVSTRDRNTDLYLWDLIENEERRLTTHQAVDESPVWDPQGTRIAFSSRRDGDQHLYVMDVRDGAIRQLTRHPGMQWAASWAPDGERICYASFDPMGAYNRLHDIWILDVETLEQTLVLGSPSDEWFPAWRPLSE